MDGKNLSTKVWQLWPSGNHYTSYSAYMHDFYLHHSRQWSSKFSGRSTLTFAEAWRDERACEEAIWTALGGNQEILRELLERVEGSTESLELLAAALVELSVAHKLHRNNNSSEWDDPFASPRVGDLVPIDLPPENSPNGSHDDANAIIGAGVGGPVKRVLGRIIYIDSSKDPVEFKVELLPENHPLTPAEHQKFFESSPASSVFSSHPTAASNVLNDAGLKLSKTLAKKLVRGYATRSGPGSNSPWHVDQVIKERLGMIQPPQPTAIEVDKKDADALLDERGLFEEELERYEGHLGGLCEQYPVPDALIPAEYLSPDALWPQPSHRNDAESRNNNGDDVVDDDAIDGKTMMAALNCWLFDSRFGWVELDTAKPSELMADWLPSGKNFAACFDALLETLIGRLGPYRVELGRTMTPAVARSTFAELFWSDWEDIRAALDDIFAASRTKEANKQSGSPDSLFSSENDDDDDNQSEYDEDQGKDDQQESKKRPKPSPSPAKKSLQPHAAAAKQPKKSKKPLDHRWPQYAGLEAMCGMWAEVVAYDLPGTQKT